jgi:hypothetical protein
MDVDVWLADDRPARVRWRDRDYLVEEYPSRITSEDVWWHPAITHPPPGWWGWRFQARDPEGTALVFDIRAVDGGRSWVLVRAYDYSGGVDEP